MNANTFLAQRSTPAARHLRTKTLWALAMHKGAENGIHASALVREICGDTSPHQERQLRQAIEELRREGHHICGEPSTGYFIAATEQELDRTCLFLHDRAITTLQQVAAMKKVAMPDLRGQLRLPT